MTVGFNPFAVGVFDFLIYFYAFYTMFFDYLFRLKNSIKRLLSHSKIHCWKQKLVTTNNY